MIIFLDIFLDSLKIWIGPLKTIWTIKFGHFIFVQVNVIEDPFFC